MKLFKSNNNYKAGEIRERTSFALLPFTVMDVVIWFKWFTVKEQYTKTDGTLNDYHWEVLSIIYW